jgi:F-type H+-transporting ATPase subunit b
MQFIDIAHAATEHEATHEAVSGAAQHSDGVLAGILGSFGITPSQFAAQFITFLVVIIVIWFLILKPITKKMSERQNIIDESLDNAKKIQERVESSASECELKIAAAKKEATMILEKAHEETKVMKEDMKMEAKKEIDVALDQAKKKITLEKEAAVHEVKAQAADLITSALEKILSEKVTSLEDKKIVEDMVKKMK